MADRLNLHVKPPDDLHDLCATLCHELIFHEHQQTFEAAMVCAFGKDVIRAAVLIDQGPLRSRLAWVVKDKTAVVLWRGTSNPIGLATNVGFSPSICHLWRDLCGDIEVHGSIMAVIEHDFYKHLIDIYSKLRGLGVDRLVFSGHSLGGGLAQVAHLATLGHMHSQGWNDLEVMTIVFAAPMVFYFSGDVPARIRTVLDRLRTTSVNWVYHTDIVPRLPGHPDFWIPLLKSLMKSKLAGAVPYLVWKLFAGEGRLDVFLKRGEYLAESAIEPMKSYRHTSQIFLLSPYTDDRAAVEVLDHTTFLSLGYDSTEQARIEERDLWAEFHLFVPRNMSRTGGYFRLQHVKSGKCLCMQHTGELTLTAALGLDCNEWYFKRENVSWHTRPPTGAFKLSGKVSKKWVTMRGDVVASSEGADLDSQYWRFAYGRDGCFCLKPLQGEALLGVVEQQGQERLGMCGVEEFEDQLWKFTRDKIRRDNVRAQGLVSSYGNSGEKVLLRSSSGESLMAETS